jgi:hypothetical protein
MGMRRAVCFPWSGLVLAGVLAVVGSARRADGADALLAAKKLVLTSQTMRLVSDDPSIAFAGEGGVGDPVAHGGTLRILSIEGDVFDTTYPLPAAGWRHLKRNGVTVGVAFAGDGPIRAVRLKAGTVLRIRARGVLGHTLGADPAPVRVVLSLGQQQYCMSFGGEVSVRPGVRFRATGAAAPDICPLPYGEDERTWACRPDLAGDDPCRDSNQDAHEIFPDGSSATQVFVDGPDDPPYDCFYVYPTVDLSGPAGNHLDVTEAPYRSLTEDPLVAHVAPFRNQCRIFAPHYRQVTFGTFGLPDAAVYFERAFRDVLDAWRLYLKYDNGGRNVVLMGHSQGTGMMTRVMQEDVDPSPALRQKLIAALLIGGSIAVPDGEVVGGTFANLPLCTSDAETGCIIAYRTYAEGFPPTNNSNGGVGPGFDQACTNPAALGGGEAHFGHTLLPTHTNQPLFTLIPGLPLYPPFALYANLYAGECVKDSTNHSYLEIRVRPGPGDVRENRIPFTHIALSPALLGTHIIDYQWPMGELLSLVATKAAAMP